MTAMQTHELLKLLRHHYIADSTDLNYQPGGIFLSEVGVNGSFGASSRVDALYVGFTSASGRILVGHELKVSKADWRHELAQTGKADKWADACHAWYVVSPSTDIVPPEELPEGWGLMLPPKAANQRRMQVVVKAHVRRDSFNPPWWALRSMLARLDTLETAERKTLVQQMANKLIEEHDRRRALANRGNILDVDTQARLGLLAKFEQELGVELGHRVNTEVSPPRYPPEVLAAGLMLAEKLRLGRYDIDQLEHGVTRMKPLLDGLDETLPELRKALGVKGQK